MYIYICIYICVYIYMYIYNYRARQAGRRKFRGGKPIRKRESFLEWRQATVWCPFLFSWLLWTTLMLPPLCLDASFSWHPFWCLQFLLIRFALYISCSWQPSIQTKQKRAAREQRNKHKPRTETSTNSSYACHVARLVFWEHDIQSRRLLKVRIAPA